MVPVLNILLVTLFFTDLILSLSYLGLSWMHVMYQKNILSYFR